MVSASIHNMARRLSSYRQKLWQFFEMGKTQNEMNAKLWPLSIILLMASVALISAMVVVIEAAPSVKPGAQQLGKFLVDY